MGRSTVLWWRNRPLWLRPTLAWGNLLFRVRVRWPSREHREALDLIRKNHLKANVAGYEADPDAVVHWDRAWIDPGFGPAFSSPYAKVPITIPEDDGIVIRVYPPKRLRKRLEKLLRGTSP